MRTSLIPAVAASAALIVLPLAAHAAQSAQSAQATQGGKTSTHGSFTLRRLRRRAVRHDARPTRARPTRRRRSSTRSTPTRTSARCVHVGDIHSGKPVLHRRPTTSRSPTCGPASRTRWSTRPATTSGPTATRRRRAAAPTTRPPGRSTTSRTRDGNPVDYAGGNPVANLALVRSIFFPTPGAHARQRTPARALAGAGRTTARTPTDAAVRRERDVAARRRRCSSRSTCPAAPTTTPTPGTARPTRRAAADTGDGAAAPAPTCAGWTAPSAGRSTTTRRASWSSAAGRHVGPRRQGRRPTWPNYEPIVQSLAAHTDGVRQAGAAAQRRLARLPLGQPAAAGVRRAPATTASAPTTPGTATRRTTCRTSTGSSSTAAPSRWSTSSLAVTPGGHQPAAATSFGPYSWSRHMEG